MLNIEKIKQEIFESKNVKQYYRFINQLQLLEEQDWGLKEQLSRLRILAAMYACNKETIWITKIIIKYI